MSKNFKGVKMFLESKNPDLLVDGMHHSPGPVKEGIAYVGGLLWTFGLMMMFFGNSVFSTLGMGVPGWFKYVKENQMMFAVGLFMMNNIAQGMMSTGAFEIYVNGELVHSRLETGTFPNQAALEEILSKVA